jgi:hypothetical protein
MHGAHAHRRQTESGPLGGWCRLGIGSSKAGHPEGRVPGLHLLDFRILLAHPVASFPPQVCQAWEQMQI